MAWLPALVAVIVSGYELWLVLEAMPESVPVPLPLSTKETPGGERPGDGEGGRRIAVGRHREGARRHRR